jgi:hypothetical protein
VAWFRRTPRCPIEDESREWLTQGLRGYADRFGIQGVRDRPVVVPTGAFFPDRFCGTLAEVRGLVGRLALSLGVDAREIDVGIDATEDDPDVAAMYFGPTAERRARIVVRSELLDDPPSLIGALAHELGHALLHAEHGTVGDEDELLTDLVTVYFGLGVLTTNAALRWRGWHEGIDQVTQIQRLGYLNQEEFAFALAAIAWARGERTKPAWATHLGANSRQTLHLTLRWFEAGNEAPLPAP